MAEANFIEEGMDRIENAYRSIERDFRRIQKRADRRRKQLEKQAEKRVKQLQSDIRKNPVVKRAESLRSDAQKAIEEQVDGLLANLRIASQADVNRLGRKVAQLNRKVRELDARLATGYGGRFYGVYPALVTDLADGRQLLQVDGDSHGELALDPAQLGAVAAAIATDRLWK